MWLLNGAVFYVLLFATGQWRHIVPTSWDVFPNAASVAIQYLSGNWPTDNTWVAYNALQLLAYFTTVFIAAPLALITGLGMSPALSMRLTVISKRLSIQAARSLHFVVLVYFFLFIVVHVTLVFATEALRNLNHMFAARDDNSWVGFWVFAAAMVVVAVGWVAATPFTYRHPRGRSGSATRSSGRCSGCSSTPTRSRARSPKRTSRRTSGTTAPTRNR